MCGAIWSPQCTEELLYPCAEYLMYASDVFNRLEVYVLGV